MFKDIDVGVFIGGFPRYLYIKSINFIKIVFNQRLLIKYIKLWNKYRK